MLFQLGITNLQKIFVQYCKIRTVEPKAFRKLTNLVELDLGENLIQVTAFIKKYCCGKKFYQKVFKNLQDILICFQEVPSEAWKHTKALMRLNLSGEKKRNFLIKSGTKLCPGQLV